MESFPNIGPKNAELLLKKFGSIRKIINSSQEELEKEVGKKAESIIKFTLALFICSWTCFISCGIQASIFKYSAGNIAILTLP